MNSNKSEGPEKILKENFNLLIFGHCKVEDHSLEEVSLVFTFCFLILRSENFESCC